MFRRFMSCSIGTLALLVVLEAPGHSFMPNICERGYALGLPHGNDVWLPR